MAATTSSGEDADSHSLKSLFDEGMQLLEQVETDSEPTNSAAMQLAVKRAMHKLEEATRLVSLAGLFSRNESAKEISTETLQYLLLPALLGSLCLKLCDRPRTELIDLADIYFRDFIKRCKDYGLTDVEIPPPAPTEEEATACPVRIQSEQQKIASMVLSRESKIKRYKEQKELKDKLVTLKKAMNSESIDDQTKREYFTTLLLSYVNLALDEMASLQQEKPILEYMAQHAGESKPNKPKAPPQPLKPIIIARDAVQKAVLGLGYPALPTFTIEEFYDQRVRDGIFPPGGGTNISHATLRNVDDVEEEDERTRRERLIEEEDPEELMRQRNMDEYKDEHRRGEGNRYNRS